MQFLHNNKRNGEITHGLLAMKTRRHPQECVHPWEYSSPNGTERRNNQTTKRLKMTTYPSPNWDFCKLQVLPFRSEVVPLTRSLHAFWTSCLSPSCSGLKCHQNMPDSSISPLWLDRHNDQGSKKKKKERNKKEPVNTLLSIWLPVWSAAWIHKPWDPSHPQPLRAHPLLSAQHRGATISRFLTRSMDWLRVIVNKQELKNRRGVSEGEHRAVA